jgi:hypothetical protein
MPTMLGKVTPASGRGADEKMAGSFRIRTASA